MPKCDCGEYASHIRQLVSGGTFICKTCRPSEFSAGDVTVTPSHKKLYRHEDAFPEMYKQKADGTLIAKEELTQDTVNNFRVDPDKEAKERKRRNRRTSPLTEDELRASLAWGEKHLKPKIIDAGLREGAEWARKMLTS